MLLLRWLIVAAVLLLISKYLPGFRVESFYNAVIAVLVIGLLNLLVKPILIVLTLPINILTLGLFTLVINAIVLQIATSIVKGFSIDSFWTALWASLILAVVGLVLDRVLQGAKTIKAEQIK